MRILLPLYYARFRRLRACHLYLRFLYYCHFDDYFVMLLLEDARRAKNSFAARLRACLTKHSPLALLAILVACRAAYSEPFKRLPRSEHYFARCHRRRCDDQTRCAQEQLTRFSFRYQNASSMGLI